MLLDPLAPTDSAGRANPSAPDLRGNRLVVRRAAPVSRPARLLWEQVRLPYLLAHSGISVHHGPHYTMPERARLPKVVTVHDLTFLDHPEWHERSKVPIFRRAIRVAAERADAVICVSSHTADRFQELCSPAGRVFVVPHGVDHSRFHPHDDVSATTDSGSTDDATLLRGLGITSRYVLFLGTLEPRKAVPALVEAFDRVAADRPDLELVLAGRPGWGAAEVDAAIARSVHRDRIRVLGYVADHLIPALLRRSAAVAYPALEEGFGLPALEALACGAPLVTTAGTPMADLAGEAAWLVRPGSVDSLAAGLAEALADPDSQEARERRLGGLAIAAKYTWDAAAAGHVEAYRWVAHHRLATGSR